MVWGVVSEFYIHSRSWLNTSLLALLTKKLLYGIMGKIEKIE